MNYLSSYRLALELKSGAATAGLNYEHEKTLPLPDNCEEKIADPTKMLCSNKLGDDKTTSLGVSVQQTFKRTGLWYFGADVGVSLFLLDAKAAEQPAKDDVLHHPQPLQYARINLHGLNARGYIQFGITPARIIPDFLISIGYGGHLSAGSLKIDERKERVEIAKGTNYFQMEIVWWRFRDGSLSTYGSVESAGKHYLKGNYAPYTNVYMLPSLTSVGILKLVLPFKTQ